MSDSLAKDLLNLVSSPTPLKPVLAKEWGKEVFIARMMADERDEMDMAWVELRDNGTSAGYRAFVVAWCLCDAENVRLFDGPERYSMWNNLRGQPAAVVDRLFDIAGKANGIMPDDEAEKEAAKN